MITTTIISRVIGAIWVGLLALAGPNFFGHFFLPLSSVEVSSPEARIEKVKLVATTTKGVYLTAYAAESDKKRAEIIDLINKTELNAVVIDIKDYSGFVLYDSQVPQVKLLHSKKIILAHLADIIREFHDAHIYVIARQTVMQDPVLAENKSEWAIHTNAGTVWRDQKGLAWVDPTHHEVWEYNIDIAKEAAGLGFDEINFDYVRFPSDGDLRTVVYAVTGTPKYAVMSQFFAFVSDQMRDVPVLTSFDLFGFVMERTGEDDLGIGQRLEDTVDRADFICPMMYPSHYPPGHLGLANPAAFPAKVLEYGMALGAPRFVGKRAMVRPWIQAFHLGAVYDAEKIRAQIDAVDRYTTGGWLLWNASARYSAAGLK